MTDDAARKPADQLDAIASLDQALRAAGLDYWLFGGWAVDFWVGRLTRDHNDTDAAAWRPAEEVEEARSRDPIARLGAVLAERGLEPSALGKMIEDARAEMREAREQANAAAWPEPAVAFEDVQDTGAVAWSKSH